MNSYSAYKDSGVEWIGEIPSHWVRTKLKYISNLYTGNSLNDSQKQIYESANLDDIAYVSSKDINVNYQTVNYDNGIRIPRFDNPLKVAKKDSFLICVEGGSAGRKMVYLNQDVCFVNKLCCFESEEVSKFQFYFVQSQQFQDHFKLSLTGLIGGVSISTLRDFEIPLPPLKEQQQIVNFLDDKTAKIDQLITFKEKKIELLKEKRTALINQVVTKGLNPDVEMKDSGVEWIGDIPEHWTVVRMKFISKITTGGKDTQDKIDNGKYPFFVRSQKVERINSFSFEGEGILTAGDGVGVGKVFHHHEGKMEIHQRVYLMYDFRLVIGKFLFLFLKNNFLKTVENQNAKSTVDSLRLNMLQDFQVALPRSKNEQEKIVEYLDTQTKEIDDLVKLEQQKIALLKEYRQSLISEVVTGKVRVCEEDVSSNNSKRFEAILNVDLLPEKIPNPHYKSSGFSTIRNVEFYEPRSLENLKKSLKKLERLICTSQQLKSIEDWFKSAPWAFYYLDFHEDFKERYCNVYIRGKDILIHYSHLDFGGNYVTNSGSYLFLKEGGKIDWSKGFSDFEFQFKICNT